MGGLQQPAVVRPSGDRPRSGAAGIVGAGVKYGDEAYDVAKTARNIRNFDNVCDVSKSSSKVVAHYLQPKIARKMSKHLKKANWDTLDTITPKYKNVRPNDRSIMKQNFIDTVHDIADRHVKGKPFDNTDGILPPHNNYYRFNVPTPGMSKAGEARLVISDSGKIYATTDHYKSFVEILGG